MAAKPSLYQVKITLRGSKPPIWRRVLVPDDFTMERFHRVIQAAMGWENSHLHEFETSKARYVMMEMQEDFDIGFGFGPTKDVVDELKATLKQALPKQGASMEYIYDFGDSWEHIILLERVLPAEGGTEYPVCVKGKGACPPDDSGGIWGYEAMLEALRNPKHPEHQHLVEWIGEDFDPEAFDLDEINERLKHLEMYAGDFGPLPFGPGEGAVSLDDMVESMEEAREIMAEELPEMIEKVEELPDGYRLTLTGDPGSWMTAANFAMIEYTLDLSLHVKLELPPQEGSITFEVTGPNAKKTLENLLKLKKLKKKKGK